MDGDQYLDVVTALTKALDEKDYYTCYHAEEASYFAMALVSALDLPPRDVDAVRLGAILHDIGKIKIPGEILTKPAALTPEEYALIKQHPTMGAEMLELFDSLKPVALIIRHHHERWDGKGYPDGLRGTEIPLGSRIVTLIDTYHAIVSNRPYRKALSREEAIRRLRAASGEQFDPSLVETFVDLLGYFSSVDSSLTHATI